MHLAATGHSRSATQLQSGLLGLTYDNALCLDINKAGNLGEILSTRIVYFISSFCTDQTKAKSFHKYSQQT